MEPGVIDPHAVEDDGEFSWDEAEPAEPDTPEAEGASEPVSKLTISLGLAIYPDHSGEINELLNYADQALYQAKEEGRNRVVIWKDS